MALWRFIIHSHGGNRRTWMWQRFGPDGRLERTSVPHATYGKAVVDALEHGFKPKDEPSSVDLPHGSMHFPPGRQPYYDDGSGSQQEDSVRRQPRESNGTRRPTKST